MHFIYTKSVFNLTTNCLKTCYFFELILFSLIFSCFSLTFLTFSFIFSYLSLAFQMLTNYSWLISKSISAGDTKVSMLLSLLLVNIYHAFSFCFLLCLVNFLLFLLLEKKLKKTCTCYSNWCSHNACKRNDRHSTNCCA